MATMCVNRADDQMYTLPPPPLYLLAYPLMANRQILARVPWGRLQDSVTKQVIPRLPKEWLLAVAGISAVEVLRREVSAQVDALPAEVQPKARVLLNQTYVTLGEKASELVESGWEVVPLVTREVQQWMKRGVGNSELEVFLLDMVQLQHVTTNTATTHATSLRALRPPACRWSASCRSTSAEGLARLSSLSNNIDTTYLMIHYLLPPEVVRRVLTLEAVTRKLDRQGLGALSVQDVYGVFTGSYAVPQALLDGVRLLSLANATASVVHAAHAQGGGGGGDAAAAYGGVTPEALVGGLNSTEKLAQAAKYTALVAESEAVSVLRAALEDTQRSINETLATFEHSLGQQRRQGVRPRPMRGAAAAAGANPHRGTIVVPLQEAAITVTQAARSAFTRFSESVNSAFDKAADPVSRGLPRVPPFRQPPGDRGRIGSTVSAVKVDVDHAAVTVTVVEDLGSADTVHHNHSQESNAKRKT
ncbi:hypothetical protein JKP88DRAFT_267165 [Tribonema minus]|uniref:Uncharacterized protein n=1 Tax=Tribonema minus TaxID=303371 RepID=A0A836CKP7_9STRA|nr:hypothetical protein JKP88DRAFT_267165 [Tribonema minus]